MPRVSSCQLTCWSFLQAGQNVRFYCSFEEGAERDMIFTLTEMCLFKPGMEREVDERNVYHCNASALDAVSLLLSFKFFLPLLLSLLPTSCASPGVVLFRIMGIWCEKEMGISLDGVHLCFCIVFICSFYVFSRVSAVLRSWSPVCTTGSSSRTSP